MIGQIKDYVSIFYAALIPAAMGGFLLTSDGQPRELIRIWVQSQHFEQMLTAVVLLCYCSIILFVIHLQLANTAHRNHAVHAKFKRLAIFVSLSPILVLAGVFAVLTLETRTLKSDTIYSFSALIASPREWIVYLTIIIFLLLLCMFNIELLRRFSFLDVFNIKTSKTTIRKINILLIIQWIFIFTLINLFEITLPLWLGPINLLILFIAFLSITFYFVTLLANQLGRSVLGLAIVIVLFSNALELNDNHEIRQTWRPEIQYLEGINQRRVGPTIAQAFSSWLETRPDIEKFDKYPVYIIAAAGGGAYAAQHSAFVLGRLQDLCPHFAQHVFAVSGVSGGAVGASMFAALAKDRAKPIANPICRGQPLVGGYTTGLAEMLSVDFLSPLLARGLFADIFQRLVPFVAIEYFDRARAFEKTVERAWLSRGGTKRDPKVFSQSYHSFWSSDGLAPAVLANVTEVGSGARFIISPFRLPEASGLWDVADASPHLDMPLSTAIALSARFPILNPAGWFKIDDASEIKTTGAFQNRSKVHLVDGGYYDNSGIATAMDIISAIRPKANSFERESKKTNSNSRRYEIILLTIDSLPDRHTRVNWLTQMLSPALTLLNVRTAKSKEYLGRANTLLPDLEREPDFVDIPGVGQVKTGFTLHRKESVREFWLNLNASSDGLKIPLGWYLSRRMSTYISAEVGKPGLCNTSSGNRFERTRIRVSRDGKKIISLRDLELIRSGTPVWDVSRQAVHCRMLSILDELTPISGDEDHGYP